jgi:hypothetical protein
MGPSRPTQALALHNSSVEVSETVGREVGDKAGTDGTFA